MKRWEWRDTPHSPKLQHHWKSPSGHTLWSLTVVQRSSRYILQLQPIEQFFSVIIFFINSILFLSSWVYRNVVLYYQFLEGRKPDFLWIAQSAGAPEYSDCISAWGVWTPHNECPGYDTKSSDGDVPVMLEFGGIWSTPSLPSLPDPLCSGFEVPIRTKLST